MPSECFPDSKQCPVLGFNALNGEKRTSLTLKTVH